MVGHSFPVPLLERGFQTLLGDPTNSLFEALRPLKIHLTQCIKCLNISAEVCSVLEPIHLNPLLLKALSIIVAARCG